MPEPCRYNGNGEENVTGSLGGNAASLGSDPHLIAVGEDLTILNIAWVNDHPLGSINIRGVGSVRLRILVGGQRLVLEETLRRIGDKFVGSNADNLSRVDVAAVEVNIGIVGKELGRVESVRVLNLLASITCLDNVGGCAVGAFRTQAESFIRVEVVAVVVDLGVDSHDLIRGCTLISTDGVASVPRFDGVRANAVTRGGSDTLGEQWEGPEGNNSDRGEHVGVCFCSGREIRI